MTAVWTPPRTWNVGELVTAGLLNTHLRDNLEFLYFGNYQIISEGLGQNITSTTFATVPGWNVTITPSSATAKWLFIFTAQWQHSAANGALLLDLHDSVVGGRLGGTSLGLYRDHSFATNVAKTATMVALASVSSARTITLQAATNTGTLGLGLALPALLLAIELVR